MKNLFYLIIVLIGFSCKGSLSDREELKSVHLGVINATPKQEKVVLEDLNATIKSIRLETNDSCILNKITQLVDVDYLWIVADRQLYKFDKMVLSSERLDRKDKVPLNMWHPNGYK